MLFRSSIGEPGTQLTMRTFHTGGVAGGCLLYTSKDLVNDKAQYTDWSNRNDIKSQLKMDLVVLLYENGYPPQWSEEVFDMVLEQAENYKS